MVDSNLQVDYEAVLADLKAKRAALDSAISAIELIASGPHGSGSAPGVKAHPKGHSTQIESDTFFHMTVPDAAKKYLAMVKKPQSTPEIAEALEKGGFTHQSANFVNTVGAVLHRSTSSPGADIMKVSRGRYGLSSWYGSSKRGEKGRDESDTGNGSA